jgi:hypothetical protein
MTPIARPFIREDQSIQALLNLKLAAINFSGHSSLIFEFHKLNRQSRILTETRLFLYEALFWKADLTDFIFIQPLTEASISELPDSDRMLLSMSFNEQSIAYSCANIEIFSREKQVEWQ